MLKISNISKKYGNNIVIDNFSMECPDVGVIAIMGASGIGKTTLLNIIAELEKPNSGTIISTFQKISYKFQEPRLLEWLTAEENISAVIEKDETSEQWLELVELSGSADKYPHELSGGMQQRVALARAMAYRGDLLLLDEPFGAVDIQTKNILITAIAEYAKSNAVILVTHDITDAECLHAKIINIK